MAIPPNEKRRTQTQSNWGGSLLKMAESSKSSLMQRHEETQEADKIYGTDAPAVTNT